MPPSSTAFGSVLVANRGEIAIRVLRAARSAGLRTVAVYSDADRDAPHVRAADTAVRLGPAPAAESYLSIPALLAAAARSGAEAVHPGYGFLSERAAFARACADAGLVFVGPPADVIERMGRKDEARRIAVAADVPVLPAGGPTRRGAADVGYPLLVKAAAGGGGKGMRIVRHPDDLAAALAAARREARAAFGDDTVLLERYVERGRHVEVQVLADAHGTVIHLFDRDCSVQRRHQKVVEEAPASTISDRTRTAIADAAVRLARAVGYVNAGTVEFLVAGDGEEQRAYFLEMNTRLQVEHAVTEAVTGLDLVRLQLDVARGRPLPVRQEQVTAVGHAVEARVYAEDPESGFLPQAGVAVRVVWPDRARVDHALESGQRVGTWYDPMLGKVVVHGATREAARQALVTALDGTAILGLTTNVGFLRRLVASDAYRDAAIDTAWLDRNPDAFPPETPDVALCAAGWALSTAPDADPHHPFAVSDGWRAAGAPAPVLVELEHRDVRYLLRVDRAGGVVEELAAGASGAGYEVRRAWTVHEPAADAGRLRLEVDAVVHDVVLQHGRGGVTVAHRGGTFTFARPDPAAAAGAAAPADGLVVAPMPGTVLAVRVEKGAEVVAGEVLAVLEAMKMEVPLRAPGDGTVDEVTVAAGQQVPLGHVLFRVVPHDTVPRTPP